ncbi:MAG: chemotaxis protein CheX [Treponema sp.]|jgi:chemotaxis protein CheX|nr:chemotaxis protein CheX [Treponema sp.]
MEQYIQPFIDVTKSTFRDFARVEIVTGRPFFQQKDTANEWDISGVIGLNGEARGAVVIGMKSALAIELTDMITGTKHSSIDDEVVDAVGEIVNIISGNAKKGLEETFRLVISLPTIVEGRGHLIKWPHEQARIICIPFNIFESETLALSVAIESLKGGTG